MNQTLLVALGGALGSMARYHLSGWVLHRAGASHFPFGTFTVNVVGCFAVGIAAALAAKHDWFSPEARLLLLTGIAGGFTTFSAFGFETFSLLSRREWLIAGGYVAASVVVGLAMMAFGYWLIPTKAP